MTSQQYGSLTVYEAAERLKVRPRTILYNIKNGFLPYKEVGGEFYIEESTLISADIWINASEAARLRGVTRQRISQETIIEGILPYRKVQGGGIYVNKKAVENRMATLHGPYRGPVEIEPSFGIEVARLRHVRGLIQYKLAAKVGVTPSTISRIESHNIKPKMHLAEKLAQELSPESPDSLMRYWGIKPMRPAAQRVRHSGRKVGIILPDLGMAYYRELLHELTMQAKHDDFEVYLDEGQTGTAQLAGIQKFAHLGVEGVILASNRMNSLDLIQLKDTVPLVVLEKPLEGSESYPHVGFVYPYERSAYVKATQHLIDIGTHFLLYIGDQYGHGTEEDRLAAIREVADRANVAVKVIRPARLDGRAGYDLVRAHLSSTQPAQKTGIIAFNSELSYGAWKAVLDANLRVPKDVAIVGGYRDRDEDELPYALTGVRIHADAMAREAFNMLHHLFQVKLTTDASEFEGEAIVSSTVELGISTVGT